MVHMLDDEKCETFADLTAAVKKHIAEHPKHGRDCACLDGLIRSVRRELGIPSIHVKPDDYKGSNGAWISEVVEVETRVSYIIRVALRRR